MPGCNILMFYSCRDCDVVLPGVCVMHSDQSLWSVQAPSGRCSKVLGG